MNCLTCRGARPISRSGSWTRPTRIWWGDACRTLRNVPMRRRRTSRRIRFTGRVRRRSLVVLLTTVVDEMNADLATRVGHALAHRHLPLVVWLRDPEVDDLVTGPPSDATRAYRRGAAAELTAWRERSLLGLRRRGALVVDARPEELSMDLLSRYLEIKARRLL